MERSEEKVLAFMWLSIPFSQGVKKDLQTIKEKKTVWSFSRTWHHFREGEEGGIVGHITGGEEESRLLLVKCSQLLLQLLMVWRVPRDVSCPARARSVFIQGRTATQKRWKIINTLQWELYFLGSVRDHI